MPEAKDKYEESEDSEEETDSDEEYNTEHNNNHLVNGLATWAKICTKNINGVLLNFKPNVMNVLSF